MSWAGAGDSSWDNAGSILTIEINETSAGAELHLTHRRFPSLEIRDRHEFGWTGTFHKLAKYLAA